MFAALAGQLLRLLGEAGLDFLPGVYDCVRVTCPSDLLSHADTFLREGNIPSLMFKILTVCAQSLYV